MKKYLFGFIAIVMAISLTAFTITKEKSEKAFTNYYWFNVPSSISSGNSLTNSDVSYLSAFQPTDPSPASCSGGSKYCHTGFTSDQVTVNGGSVTLNGSQTPGSYNSKP